MGVPLPVTTPGSVFQLTAVGFQSAAARYTTTEPPAVPLDTRSFRTAEATTQPLGMGGSENLISERARPPAAATTPIWTLVDQLTSAGSRRARCHTVG